jgi:hypothetical protein
MAKRKVTEEVEDVNGETGIQMSQTLALTKRGVEQILTRWAKGRGMPVSEDGVKLTIGEADDAVIATVEAGWRPMVLRTRNRGGNEST